MDKFFTYSFIIGAAQGFLLAMFLFKKKENKLANKLLAITMLIFSFDLVLEATAVTGDIKSIPTLIGLMQSFPYLYGPSIFLYILFITRGIKKFRFKYILHYLPFLLVQIYGLFFFYFEPSSYQLNLVYIENKFPWHLLFISFLTPIYGGIYLILAVYKSYQFKQEVKNKYSNIDKYNLSWIMFLVVGGVLLWIVAIIMTSLQIVYDNEIKPELVSYLAISIFIYAMAYKGLRQPEVYPEEVIVNTKSGLEKSYKKSGLNEITADKYVKSLMKLMDEEKPYKNEKLNLTDLSNLLDISTHNLSEIINKNIEMNFYDFINSYRVEEAKKLISNDDTKIYSILSHGMEAGFSSKSAFYSAFKKHTGMTPAQYRNNK